MGAHKILGSPVQLLYIQGVAVLVDKPLQKGVFDLRVEDFVHIPLALAVVAGVEIKGDLPAVEDRHIPGEVDVQRLDQPVTGDGTLGF